MCDRCTRTRVPRFYPSNSFIRFSVAMKIDRSSANSFFNSRLSASKPCSTCLVWDLLPLLLATLDFGPLEGITLWIEGALQLPATDFCRVLSCGRCESRD